MKVLTDNEITELGITPRQCVDWAERSLRSKPNADLPPKTWQHFPNDVFVNTMPCLMGNALLAWTAIGLLRCELAR